MRRILFAVLAVLALPSAAGAAAADNNVEWNGVSHVGWQDRRPLCPVGGESFQVRFQTYVNDITSARVHADDGTVTWVTAAKVGTRSVYDVWAAAIPASTPGGTVRYWIELTDGSDTDYYSVGGTSDGTPVDGGFVVDFATLEHAPIGATRTSGGGAHTLNTATSTAGASRTRSPRSASTSSAWSRSWGPARSTSSSSTTASTTPTPAGGR